MADESKYPTRIAPYGLRMPDDLKARVQAAAEANNRSMNAEIVYRLEESFYDLPGIKAVAVGQTAIERPTLEQLVNLVAERLKLEPPENAG